MMAGEATGPGVVVIMAKPPAPGRTKTRLSPHLSPADAAELYEALLTDTIALVSRIEGQRMAVAVTPAAALETWRPEIRDDSLVLGVDGADVGECLAAITARLLGSGFSRVIALNSDGPTLPAGRIERAFALLDDHDVVVGPGEDGGYYLIGLRGPQPHLFRDIPWSTGQVTAATMDRAAALGLSVATLPAWYDVDTGADVARLRAELANLPPDIAVCARRFFTGRPPSCEEIDE